MLSYIITGILYNIYLYALLYIKLYNDITSRFTNFKNHILYLYSFYSIMNIYITIYIIVFKYIYIYKQYKFVLHLYYKHNIITLYETFLFVKLLMCFTQNKC